MEEERFYYKSDNALMCFKHALEEIPEGTVELTEQEYIEESERRNSINNPRPSQSENHIKKVRIKELQKLLKQTDYQAIKYAEGWLTEQEYVPIKAERQSWRDEINELQAELEEE